MRLSQKQWEELCAKTGIQDTATSADEEQRKRDINMKILLAYWGAIDRQWMQDYRQKQRELKQAQKQKHPVKEIFPERRSPLPQLTLPPYKPFKFDARPAWNAPEKLIRMGNDYMDRFRWIEYD